MNRTTLRVLGVLAFAFLVGLLAAGCQDDGPSLTGASSVTESASQLATTSPSHSNSGESSGEDDEDGDDDSEDDTSDDDSDDAGEDDESDDAGEDDESDDDADDDSDDESADDDSDSEVRGLLFATTTCPVSVADCVLALLIKDTLVAVTNETEIVNEPAGETLLTAAELATIAGAHPGLPMRAEGTSEGGVLVAQRLRIDDEIRASGQVTELPGCGLGLAVEPLQLCFDLSPGLAAPAPLSTVRVEGSVPISLTPFLATEIESSND